jgi:hypothetical protein
MGSISVIAKRMSRCDWCGKFEFSSSSSSSGSDAGICDVFDAHQSHHSLICHQHCSMLQVMQQPLFMLDSSLLARLENSQLPAVTMYEAMPHAV